MIVEKPLPYMRKEAFLLWSPHACGEYGRPPKGVNCGVGSSPRVWGIRHAAPQPDQGNRFIPTRVGNTARPKSGNDPNTVHPHACGEYSLAPKPLMPRSGSSPRVWGILRRDANRGTCIRFIPTRVGNTALSWMKSTQNTVHPHACGEYCVATLTGSHASGSSPRVWGIRTLFLLCRD